MEFFKDHFSRIKTLLLFSFFLTGYQKFATGQSVYEQIGKLPITTYLADEYEGYAQVWSAVKGDNGLMYFGTNYGLHEYDGVSWRSVFKEELVQDVRWLGKDQSGRIFYSGTDAFGYLEVDQFGVTQPVSLFHLIPGENLPTGSILTFHFIGNYIYLQSLDYIFRLELDEEYNLKTLKTWIPETRFMYSFLQDGILYIHQIDRGLFRIEEEELAFLQGTEILGKERLRIMLPYFGNSPNKTYLLGSFNSGFYLFDGENLTKFPTQIDDFLKDGATLNIGLVLDDGNYLLSLMGSGAAIMNPKGEVIRIINSNHGLPSDLVIGSYLDNAGSLWILTEDGISWVDVNSPTLDYGKDLGIKSYVFAIEKIEDELYLGTNHGLLKFDHEAKVFTPIPEINKGQIRDLLLDGKDLIITGEKLHVLRNDKLIALDNPKSGTVSHKILIPKENQNILYVGTNSGLFVYRRGISSQVPWELIGEVAGIDRAVYSLIESKDGDLWVGTQAGIAFKVTKQDSRLDYHDLEGYNVKSFEGEGGSFYFNSVNGDIYSPSFSELKKYSKSQGVFVRATEFDDIAINITYIFEDPLKRVWLITENLDLMLVTQNEDGTYKKLDYKGLMSSNFSDIGFLDTDSSMWFGSFQLVRFDPKKDSHREKPFFTLLRRIETKTDTLELIQYGRNLDLPARELKDNSFRFEFAAPYFDGEKYFSYQTFLEGFDADWVDWNDYNFKEYTNLPPGNYIFRVRALNTTLLTSEEAVFSFIVLPPWYATWWAYTIYALILGLIIYWIVKFQSERLVAKEKEKARENELAHAKEIEKAYHKLENAHQELEESHQNLKSTQAQLIQSEKMASLGQLTAGIAHEIQNPLNFVNNFSDVSNELINEVEVERAKNQEARDETLVSEILGEIKGNLSKISHHGKRADAIVKGMLEHSRASSGEKVPTDINALADEYLRLSYHGMRAKDKSFSAEFKTDFDPNLPKIKVVPQEIGRVLLNIINNAFQATNEPSKGSKPLEGYKPLVTISTKNLGEKIEISVKDNGPGIPDSIKDKIFQPFFTTKPTGEGTGLGLSLSYDIVKAHGGELKVETEVNKGSEFIIVLPSNPSNH